MDNASQGRDGGDRNEVPPEIVTILGRGCSSVTGEVYSLFLGKVLTPVEVIVKLGRNCRYVSWQEAVWWRLSNDNFGQVGQFVNHLRPADAINHWGSRMKYW